MQANSGVRVHVSECAWHSSDVREKSFAWHSSGVRVGTGGSSGSSRSCEASDRSQSGCFSYAFCSSLEDEVEHSRRGECARAESGDARAGNAGLAGRQRRGPESAHRPPILGGLDDRAESDHEMILTRAHRVAHPRRRSGRVIRGNGVLARFAAVLGSLSVATNAVMGADVATMTPAADVVTQSAAATAGAAVFAANSLVDDDMSDLSTSGTAGEVSRRELAASKFRDVCTDEVDDVCHGLNVAACRAQLCGPTFLVSTLAFNPNGPASSLTLILLPSEPIGPSEQDNQVQFILTLPGLRVPANHVDVGKTGKAVTVKPGNVIAEDQDPQTAYNSPENRLFEENSAFDLVTEQMRLVVIYDTELQKGKTARADIVATSSICCFLLPLSLPANPPTFTIAAAQGQPTAAISTLDPVIMAQQIKSVPAISRGNYWDHLEVRFDPAISLQNSVVRVKVRAAEEISDAARLIVYMPMLRRNPESASYRKWSEIGALQAGRRLGDRRRLGDNSVQTALTDAEDDAMFAEGKAWEEERSRLLSASGAAVSEVSADGSVEPAVEAVDEDSQLRWVEGLHGHSPDDAKDWWSTHRKLSDSWVHHEQELEKQRRLAEDYQTGANYKDLSGEFDFTTDGDEWILFRHRALYNDTEKSLTFFLRENTVLYPNMTVTFVTNLDEFFLPLEVESNAPSMQVAARSADKVDVIIEPTGIFQVD